MLFIASWHGCHCLYNLWSFYSTFQSSYPIILTPTIPTTPFSSFIYLSIKCPQPPPQSPSLILQTDLLLDVIPQACHLGKPYHPTPCQSPNSSLFQQLAFCLPECMRCASPITPYSSECRWVRAGPGHDAAPTRCRWWSTYPAHEGKVAFTHLCAGGMLGQHSSQGVPEAADLRGVGS